MKKNRTNVEYLFDEHQIVHAWLKTEAALALPAFAFQAVANSMHQLEDLIAEESSLSLSDVAVKMKMLDVMIEDYERFEGVVQCLTESIQKDIKTLSAPQEMKIAA